MQHGSRNISALPDLGSDRIRLRPLQPDDAQPLYRSVYGDPDVMRFVAGGSHESVSQTEAAIAEYIAHGEQHGFTFWGVEDAESGEILGDCGLYLLEGRGPDVEFGVTLRERSWGCGIGALCARACIAHAFSRLGLDRVVAIARKENTASIHLLERTGFRHTGSVEVYGGEHERFQMNADEWQEASDGS